jgi:hypothetical protein
MWGVGVKVSWFFPLKNLKTRGVKPMKEGKRNFMWCYFWGIEQEEEHNLREDLHVHIYVDPTFLTF